MLFSVVCCGPAARRQAERYFLMAFVVFVGISVVPVTESAFAVPLQVRGTMSEMRNSEQFDEWIVRARARLAARRNGRPSTKSGAIRALWPEIQQALHSGQTLKTVRDWLEAEGVSVRYNQLATYVARLRRKQARASEVPPREPTVQAEIRTEDTRPAPEPGPAARDPLANLRSREGRPRTFEYNPEFKEEELL